MIACPSVSSKLGVVATGDSESSLAGTLILEQAGNAADAAAAALLMLGVTRIGSFCLGGEVPMLIYDAHHKQVKVIGGQGAAPMDERAILQYRQYGIPGQSIRAATVPAVVDACVTLISRFGSMSFEQIAQPVLATLSSGRPPSYFDTALKLEVDAKSGKIIDGGSSPLPEKLGCWSQDLLETLKGLIVAENSASGDRRQKLQAVSNRFYRGDIARELCDWYQDRSGYLRGDDLARHETIFEDPVSVDYRGYTIHKCGPWTQGPWLCQVLKILEWFDLRGMGPFSADYVHTVIESMKLALADRDQFFGDPRFVDVPLPALLSDEYTALRKELVSMTAASHVLQPGDPYGIRALHPEPCPTHEGSGGTTVCIVADRDNNVVVATPSGLGSTAGSGGATGITHGTRLKCFNTIEGHPNCVQPGKRPRTTPSPTLILKSGRPYLALSITGGDLQDQLALQWVLDTIDFKRSLEDSSNSPRFFTGHFESSFGHRAGTPGEARIQHGYGQGVIAELKERGHIIAPASVSADVAAMHFGGGVETVQALASACAAVGC